MTYVVVDKEQLDADLTVVADAIREKGGTSEPLVFPSGMVEAVKAIQSGGNGLAYDMGEFVLTESVAYKQTTDGIPHMLGESPDFVLVWTDDFSYLSEENLTPYDGATSLGYMWLNGLFGMTQRLSSVNSSDYGVFLAFALNKDDYRLQAATPTAIAYVMKEAEAPTKEKIGIVQLATVQQLWRSGIKYKYFVSKAWWNVGGIANAE